MVKELKLDIISEFETILNKMRNGYQVRLEDFVNKIYYCKFVESSLIDSIVITKALI